MPIMRHCLVVFLSTIVEVMCCIKTHRFRCNMMISGGFSRQVSTVVSLLSLHTEHTICSPPVRIVCLKNSDRQSCKAKSQNCEAAWDNTGTVTFKRCSLCRIGLEAPAPVQSYLNGALAGISWDWQRQHSEGLCAVCLVITVHAQHHIAQLALEQM